ncbi:response regulator [Vibrio sp. TRT 1302]|uniref:response regulator n=1 Tax=Vibrio sp. TRT 1302 TaxID=3418504 RepID=UPI003CF986E6
MKILIVDDHPLVCAALKQVIEDHFQHANVEQVFEADKALLHLAENKVDLLILDIELDGDDGFELLNKAKLTGFEGKTIIISSKDEQLCSDIAINAGVSGYLDKKESVTRAVDAINAVLNGYTFFRSHQGRMVVKLSNQESTVLRLLLEGHTNKSVARKMDISEKTVSTYKRRVLDKYGVKSVFNLVKHLKVISL